MAHDDIDAYEAALRRLPEAHSLALRLMSAGVADDVVCGYLHIEPEGMETLLRVAEEKLEAELTGPREGVHGERESFVGGYGWQRGGPAAGSPGPDGGGTA